MGIEAGVGAARLCLKGPCLSGAASHIIADVAPFKRPMTLKSWIRSAVFVLGRAKTAAPSLMSGAGFGHVVRAHYVDNARFV